MTCKRFVMSCAVLGLMIGAPALAATKPEVATPPPPKEASFHVKCDGNPNNMSGAESAVRMITLAAVVGLLAPPPEAADPTKRKLGADGVAACDAVLTGDKAETNVNRRMQLTLARALHQIEAKNYTAAIADVALARKEATAAGLTADRYFMQSAGMSFDRIEAAALIRMGKEEEAATVAARSVEEHRFNLLPLLRNDVYPEFSRSGKDALWYDYVARLDPPALTSKAAHLEDLGRFADAVKAREGSIQFDRSFTKEAHSSYLLANAALAHALAGNWTTAIARADEARSNDKTRVAEGKPESNRSETSEILDLFEVLKLAHDGNTVAARRMFSGRSQWLAPSLGSVMAANALLRPGAKPDELVGILAKSPDALWNERKVARLAALTAADGDNKTLFRMISPLTSAGVFENLSGKVWKTDKSKILSKEPNKDLNATLAFIYDGGPTAKYDATLLHTALMAKKDGKKGVLILPMKSQYSSVWVRMGDPGDPAIPAELYIDADAAIAALSPLIPDPVTLKAKRAAKK